MAATMNSHHFIHYVSECLVQPKHIPQDSEQRIYLAPWDLCLASLHYNQKGLLFAKPPAFDSEGKMKDYLQKLKESLSLTLVHFYPLAGRLATLKQENPPIYSIYVDCTNLPGAKFVHASVDLTIDDILTPIYMPKIVYSFFDHVGAVNHDGHSMSLMSIQVTELKDGIFIGWSTNHLLVDGTSFWHFINTWSEVFNAKGQISTISRPPILKRWFPEGHRSPVFSLPFAHHDEFISRFQTPELLERYFHFSAESLAKLKAKANAECNSTNISTFQALSALLWRCITRARNMPSDQQTSAGTSVNSRLRINPPLSEEYFGNCVQVVAVTTTCGELLTNGLGWAAWKLHELVINQTDRSIREWVESWVKSPFIVWIGRFSNRIQIGSSPRFNIYGSEFGLGKALAVRSGFANKPDGKITLFPGREGGGSMDVEVCLLQQSMSFLESDQEFMENVSS
ncbi:uncharacterized acetyltransferase At3g50280 [Coffea arabica]|uniref:Uncharacterized acetyltransferase At3g50280 n=1 Tax=Coffea arabica TaxID=13443 RepID=A0A6P6SZ53_COFAR|nr:uncharacterized acetyltransferase At3g50280-like [Coffea arabica]